MTGLQGFNSSWIEARPLSLGKQACCQRSARFPDRYGAESTDRGDKRVHNGECVKVLVLWADNKSANLGVRVLASGTAELARAAWGDQVRVDYQDFAGTETGVSLGRKNLFADFGRRNGRIKSLLREYDVILDTGAGDSFTDGYGLERLIRMTRVQSLATNNGVPIIMTPQTLGPFNSYVGRSVARSSLRNMRAVLVRDSDSLALATQLGRPLSGSTTDVVFALPKPAIDKSRDIVFNVSGLLWAENRHVSFTKYRGEVRRFIKLATESGRSISLLAHVLDNPSVDNDVTAISELGREFGPEIEVVIPSSLEEARETVASARFVVGSRMHACLNSLSTGTPTIPWAYSKKFAPLLRDIGWESGLDLRSDSGVASSTIDQIEEWDTGSTAVATSTVTAIATAKLELAVETLRESLRTS